MAQGGFGVEDAAVARKDFRRLLAQYKPDAFLGLEHIVGEQ